MPGSATEPEDLGSLLDAISSGEQYLVSVGAACRAMTREDPASRTGRGACDVYLTKDVPPGDPRIPTAAFERLPRRRPMGCSLVEPCAPSRVAAS